jgi:hypothetical protein
VDAAELYRVPLDDFVTARSALATQLRSAGDREAAAAVARARKPSLGAWTVDQLAHTAPDAVAELLAAAADATETQRAALAHGTEATIEVREASARFKKALEDLAARARVVLETSGLPATDANVRRAQTTAHAAAVGGPATRGALFRGTLDRELDPPGFVVMDEFEADLPDVSAAIAARRGRRGPAPREAQGPPDVSRVRELSADLRAAEREAEEKRRAADRVAAHAARTAERADRLADEARAARQEAAVAERAVVAAEEAAQTAEALRDSVRASLPED